MLSFKSRFRDLFEKGLPCLFNTLNKWKTTVAFGLLLDSLLLNILQFEHFAPRPIFFNKRGASYGIKIIVHSPIADLICFNIFVSSFVSMFCFDGSLLGPCSKTSKQLFRHILQTKIHLETNSTKTAKRSHN